MASPIIPKNVKIVTKKRNTNPRKRVFVRFNKKQRVKLKEACEIAFPGKRKQKSLFIEQAITDYLNKPSYYEAEWEDPANQDALYIFDDVLLGVNVDNLGPSESIYLNKSVYSSLLAAEVKIRQFMETKLNSFKGRPPYDSVLVSIVRRSVESKLYGKIGLMTALKKLNL